MGRTRTAKRSLLASLLLAVCIAAFAPAAYAAAPNLSGDGSSSSYIDRASLPDATFLALKDAYRIRSGMRPNQPKGTQAHMYVTKTPGTKRALPDARAKSSPQSIIVCDPSQTPPCSYQLSTNNAVPYVYEPSSGCCSNYGTGTTSQDDATNGPNGSGKNYSDSNFFGLCGPGAADVALWYWPNPPNWTNSPNVVDPKTNVSTTWNGTDRDGVGRMRGYMTYLAWQMKASGWSNPGMMEQYSGGGVRLQEESVALNWEETGRTSNSGFYIVAWRYDATYNPGGHTETDFYNDVVSDLYYNNAPVVPEVNAQLLPNWPNKGGQTLHFITIIGYDDGYHNSDGSYGRYAYTDTCGNTTNCGSNNDAGVNHASYNQMWNAIMGAPYNQSTGDGGWVW